MTYLNQLLRLLFGWTNPIERSLTLVFGLGLEQERIIGLYKFTL